MGESNMGMLKKLGIIIGGAKWVPSHNTTKEDMRLELKRSLELFFKKIEANYHSSSSSRVF
jgi:hypothetical protein